MHESDPMEDDPTTDPDGEADGLPGATGTITLTRKTICDHARCVMAGWKALLLTVASAFGVLCGLAEALSYFVAVDLRGWPFLATAFTVAALAGLTWAISSYKRRCPPGFEGESPTAARIAHLQGPLWEFDLADSLLKTKLAALDEELQGLLDERVYVAIRARYNIMEYIGWASVRCDNVMRMVGIAGRLLTDDFIGSFASSCGKPADPARILSAVDGIRDFYAQTVAFEREAHEVAPPGALSRVHELQVGWTDPIRDAVRQLFDFVSRARSPNVISAGRVSFTITFKELPNVDAFVEELGRLKAILPKLLAHEEDLQSTSGGRTSIGG